jgi:two-component system CheB/CheR fusion protein
VKDRRGNWYSLRVRPYKTPDGTIEGAVITLIDIHELKSEVAEIQKYAEAIVATTREAILVLDAELRVKVLNDAFLETFQVTREETEGREVYELGGGEWNNPKLLRLLREILPKQTEIKDFQVIYDFPRLGRRVMRLNASQIKRAENRPDWILLAFEDITEGRQSKSA